MNSDTRDCQTGLVELSGKYVPARYYYCRDSYDTYFMMELKYDGVYISTEFQPELGDIPHWGC